MSVPVESDLKALFWSENLQNNKGLPLFIGNPHKFAVWTEPRTHPTTTVIQLLTISQFVILKLFESTPLPFYHL
jgi:hypothetical protein